MKSRKFAVAAAISAFVVLLGVAPSASAAPPDLPAFAYGLIIEANWGAHDNVFDVAHFDEIPAGRNIGVTIVSGPSFGHITVLSTMGAKGVPLVAYRANSRFFSGSDSFRYRLVDLDTGEPLDEGVGFIAILEAGDSGTTADQYATYDGPNNGFVGVGGAGGSITSAVAGDGQVALTWPSNAGSTLRVYDGLTLRRISVAGLTSTTVTGLTNGTSYWFRLANEPWGSAYEVGATGPLVPSVAVVPPPAPGPAAPPPVTSSESSKPAVTAPVAPLASATPAPTPTSTPTPMASPQSTPSATPTGDSAAASTAAEPQSPGVPVWIWFLGAAILVLIVAGLVVVRLVRTRF